MKFTKKIVAILLVVVMAFAMASTSFAASGDPNLTNYNTLYTYSVQCGDEELITLMATTADQYWNITGFDTEAAAEAVQWSVVDGSIDGVFVIDPEVGSYAEPLDNGKYAATAYVYVDADAEVGAASIEAMNPANGATMNFTIIVNGGSQAYSNVTYKFYNGDAEILPVSGLTVSGNGIYGNTQYASALDGLFPAWTATSGNTVSLSAYSIVNYGTYYVDGLTFIVDGRVVELREYTDDDWNYFGWQYRVYHNGQIVPLSELIGADECQIHDGDTVVWKYGKYGDVTFAPTI